MFNSQPFTPVTLISAGTIRADVSGSAVDISEYVGGAVASFNIGAILGGTASPVCVPRIQTAGTASGPWTTVTEAGTIGTAGTLVNVSMDTQVYSKYVRVQVGVAGTNPIIPFGATLIGRKQNIS